MALHDNQDFLPMLDKFPGHVREIAIGLREFIWECHPESNELIYGKKNGLAVGWGFTDKASDIFVSFACYPNHVNFGFQHGNLLDDPKGLLTGSGSQYRHIKVVRLADFPFAEMEAFMQASWVNVHAMLKPKAKLLHGATILKSVAPGQ